MWDHWSFSDVDPSKESQRQTTDKSRPSELLSDCLSTWHHQSFSDVDLLEESQHQPTNSPRPLTLVSKCLSQPWVIFRCWSVKRKPTSAHWLSSSINISTRLFIAVRSVIFRSRFVKGKQLLDLLLHLSVLVSDYLSVWEHWSFSNVDLSKESQHWPSHKSCPSSIFSIWLLIDVGSSPIFRHWCIAGKPESAYSRTSLPSESECST